MPSEKTIRADSDGRWVFGFDQGSAEMRELLGNKRACLVAKEIAAAQAAG